MPSKLPRKPTFRKRRHVPVDMTKHKAGDVLIQHIRAFDKKHHFCAGACYRIGGNVVAV